MHRVVFTCAILALCVISTSGASPVNLVTNGGFERSDFTGWTLSNTDFNFVDGTPHSGTYAAWLGPIGSLNFLSQTLATVPGTLYELHYWLRHEPFGSGTPSAFQVSWGGTIISDQTALGTFPYTEFVFRNLVPTGASTELKFGFREDTDYFQLDDASVQAVPEPSATLLLATSLLGLLAYGWRRRKQAV